ncbi:hypothetical protein NG799_01960 [Laspinema sp. D1]|uniref:Uncharacterized protein n=1 Tax=Laspinema palackyanum D2a TaxID=2953684 RepID=A0ABT2MK27_9CYAN|nr:hypothetical protein [Laspinema sp. D2a]
MNPLAVVASPEKKQVGSGGAMAWLARTERAESDSGDRIVGIQQAESVRGDKPMA